MRRAPLLVAAVVALAGCGGGGTPSSSTSPSPATSSTAPTPTPTPTPSGDSIAQIASVVAQIQASFKDVNAAMDENCGIPQSPNPLACGTNALAVQLGGEAAYLRLQRLKPPAEVKDLFDETLAGAKELKEFDVSDCEKDVGSDDCQVSAAALSAILSGYLDKLAGWQPYM